MLFTPLLAALIASAAAAKDKRTFAVLHHYGKGPLTTCRADPIVSPGGPASHVHTVMGASNFGLNATGESLRRSSCTTARLKGDLSAYWFPTLYFQDPATGLLEQVSFDYMNAYYFFDATNDDIKAFPVGLQMVSGNAQLRTAPSKSGANQLDPSQGPVQPAQITCPRPNFNPPSWPAGSDGSMAGIQDPNNKGSGIGFPFQPCDGLYSPLRVDVHFPSCYNPSAGLTNYKSNMQFPTAVAGGKLDCPPGWIHVPHLFFETYWQTQSLLPRYQSLIGKASPFVFSNGDATGFSAHGDFLAGWDEAELQNIIDNCDAGTSGMENCPGLKLGLNDPSGSCNIECPINEAIDGKLGKLPGNNPLAGWGRGGGNPPPPPPAPAPSPSPSASPSPAPNPPPGYGNSNSGASSSQVPVVAPVASSSSSRAAPTSPVQPPAHVSSQAAGPSSSADNSVTNHPNPPPQPTAQPGKTETVYETVTVWETKTVCEDAASPAPTQCIQQSSASADTAGFSYVGCYRDASDRVLSGEVRPSIGGPVSAAACVRYCASRGYSLAGAEYGGECYCGNGLARVEKLDESKCGMACRGDAGQTCGGGWALSLYAKGGTSPSPSQSPGSYKRLAARHYHLHHARVPSRRRG